MPNEGIRKSAILLMSLGEEAAGSVLQHLSQSDVQALGQAMVTLARVKRGEIADVMEEFRLETEQYSALHLDSGSYLRAVLSKAMGDDRAADLLESILQSGDSTTGIERLNQLDLRFGKLFRLGGVRTSVNLDVFNALNSNAVLTENFAYASWRVPLAWGVGLWMSSLARLSR